MENKQIKNIKTTKKINDSSEFNFPIQSTNYTQITNSALNKDLIENSNTLINPNDFGSALNTNNFNNNKNNNDYIYDHLQDNLIIPRNFNENPPADVRPRKRSKIFLFCVSLIILFLVLTIVFLFLLFFTDFVSNEYSLNLTTYHSNWNRRPERENTSIIYVLANLQIDCPSRSLLTSFNLETENNQDYYYKFTCGEAPFYNWSLPIKKESNYVNLNGKNDNEFEALSKLNVICPFNSAITGLKLNYNPNLGFIYYSYSCLEIQGNALFRVECRDFSNESVYVSGTDVNSLLDLKCADHEHRSRFLNMFLLNYKEKHGYKKAHYSTTFCGINN